MDLVRKEIEFHKEKILTVKLGDVVYVAVKSICECLGMDKSKADHQIQKIQKDETLKLGVKKLSLNFQSQVREQLFIELDFFPIWLAKINPARFDEKLKDKLLDYQLHCKDVLADEFKGKRELKLPGRETDSNVSDIKIRADRIDASKQQISELLIQIMYDSYFIKCTAGMLEREAKAGYKNNSDDKHLVAGRMPTVEEIDEANELIRNRIKEDLKKTNK